MCPVKSVTHVPGCTGSSTTGWGYDRTLAVRVPRPRTVGIGVTALRMASIPPQTHELSMDVMRARRTQ